MAAGKEEERRGALRLKGRGPRQAWEEEEEASVPVVHWKARVPVGEAGEGGRGGAGEEPGRRAEEGGGGSGDNDVPVVKWKARVPVEEDEEEGEEVAQGKWRVNQVHDSAPSNGGLRMNWKGSQAARPQTQAPAKGDDVPKISWKRPPSGTASLRDEESVPKVDWKQPPGSSAGDEESVPVVSWGRGVSEEGVAAMRSQEAGQSNGAQRPSRATNQTFGLQRPSTRTPPSRTPPSLSPHAQPRRLQERRSLPGGGTTLRSRSPSPSLRHPARSRSPSPSTRLAGQTQRMALQTSALQQTQKQHVPTARISPAGSHGARSALPKPGGTRSGLPAPHKPPSPATTPGATPPNSRVPSGVARGRTQQMGGARTQTSPSIRQRTGDGHTPPAGQAQPRRLQPSTPPRAPVAKATPQRWVWYICTSSPAYISSHLSLPPLPSLSRLSLSSLGARWPGPRQSQTTTAGWRAATDTGTPGGCLWGT